MKADGNMSCKPTLSSKNGYALTKSSNFGIQTQGSKEIPKDKTHAIKSPQPPHSLISDCSRCYWTIS
ncbi:hypothetical protein Nepgr_033105 [Nepenthes gracilis]|uniref:Uncharacterized protein n=1 Tax=Nepenthes gracilis TaxID=150966 RepID=A0AAD3TM35_NEPGR|nr:hypothetical protein Nepgr_033105 [Nepenthes gracilis]